MSERVITMHLRTNNVQIKIIEVYAMADSTYDTEKDEFYGQLQDTFDKIHHCDLKNILGDFNAQLGSDRNGLEPTIGPFTLSEHLSNNEERLISF